MYLPLIDAKYLVPEIIYILQDSNLINISKRMIEILDKNTIDEAILSQIVTGQLSDTENICSLLRFFLRYYRDKKSYDEVLEKWVDVKHGEADYVSLKSSFYRLKIAVKEMDQSLGEETANNDLQT